LPPVLHALITFAATEEGAETSKTLFYLAGGILVLFAILVSAVGIVRRDTFPPSKGVAGGVMAVAALLVAFVMAAAVITG
jgi:hypothetical protein